MSSKGRTWIGFRSAVSEIALLLMVTVAGAGNAIAATTHYIAANGSDGNNGTSTTTPWAHAPGMPNCSGSCASYTPQPGDQFIFRGGDTWHFLNSSATPYTGGTWKWSWSGTSTSCVTTGGGPTSTCIYIGVDQTWYSGSSWVRPILTGDNATSTSAVSACAYPGGIGSQDDMFVNNATLVIFDNFEMTGLCQDVASSSSNGYGYGRDKYITDNGNGASATQNQYSNNYIHGWTHVAFSCSEPSGEPVGICYSISAFTGTGNTMSTLGPQNVCDGWDSDPSGGGCIQSMTGYNIYENVFAHQSQIETGGCHSIHDNLWQYFYPTGDGEAHGNQLECNTDFPQTDNSGHPQTGASINVFYNNILGHNAPGNATNGDVKVWFCVTTIPEYWFNNLLYDQGTANYWDIDTHDYNCSTSGVQYMFNNTFDVPGAGAINNVASLVATGNHTIVDGGSAFASGTGTISNTISMTHATAVTQGYMANGTGTSGNNNNVTCANDITPCAPTASLNSTVGAGTNLYNSYCTTLAGSSDPVIALAGTACKSATTEACSYNTSTRSVSCPGATVNARPTGGNGAWDAGINEYNSSNPPPNPPTGLAAVVN